MFNVTRRTSEDNLKLSICFGMLGGYTAILSLVVLGIFANCMTGNTTRAGLALGSSNYYVFLDIFSVFIAFIFGAYISTLIFNKLGYIPVLLAEGLLLVLIGLGKIGMPYEAWFAATAMGLQNAFTTCVSWDFGKVRTTHVTGALTDFGVAISNLDTKKVFHIGSYLSSYLVGAVLAYFAARSMGNQAFVIGAFAVVAALVVDGIGNVVKSNQPINQIVEE